MSIPLLDPFAFAGKSAVFYAAASGAWPLAYQWQLQGTNIPSATSEQAFYRVRQWWSAGPKAQRTPG